MNHWWRTFFDDDYLRIWRQLFSEENNAKQAAELWSMLDLSPGCKMLDDWEAIGNVAIAAAKLDGDRTIRAFYRRVAIYRIGTVFVLFKIALGVVDGGGPETIDGHASNRSPVNGRSVIPLRPNVEIERVLLGSATPKHCASDH